MCEHCKETGVVSVEKYEADADELCEFVEEPDDLEDYQIDPPMCEKTAQYLMVETTVEDHLCPEHVTKTQTEEGDGDLFAESIGMGSSTVVKIETDYVGMCQYFDPLDPNPPKCTQRATHARILEFETLYCEEHLKQYQEELKS